MDVVSARYLSIHAQILKAFDKNSVVDSFVVIVLVLSIWSQETETGIT